MKKESARFDHEKRGEAIDPGAGTRARIKKMRHADAIHLCNNNRWFYTVASQKVFWGVIDSTSQADEATPPPLLCTSSWFFIFEHKKKYENYLYANSVLIIRDMFDDGSCVLLCFWVKKNHFLIDRIDTRAVPRSARGERPENYRYYVPCVLYE